MNELTTKQNEIINEICNQFIKLNDSQSNASFNLLDVNFLNAEINRIEIGKKELAIYNHGMYKTICETMKNYNNELNGDFKSGSLPLKAEALITDMYKIITIKPLSQNLDKIVSNYHHIKIEAINKLVDTEYGQKITHYVFTTDRDMGTDNKVVANSVKEFLSNKIIQTKLVRLVEEIKKAEKV